MARANVYSWYKWFYLGQCCNDLEVNLEDLFTDPTLTFNGGRFKKQIFYSHQKVVYHDDESDYYIYYTGNEWVVSSILVPFS